MVLSLLRTLGRRTGIYNIYEARCAQQTRRVAGRPTTIARELMAGRPAVFYNRRRWCGCEDDTPSVECIVTPPPPPNTIVVVAATAAAIGKNMETKREK